MIKHSKKRSGLWYLMEKWIATICLSILIAEKVNSAEADYRFGHADKLKRNLKRVNRLLDHGNPWHDKARG